MFRIGDKVRIKPEWRDAGDNEIEWIVVGEEEKGRVDIQPQIDLPIKPTQTVDVSMIERA